MQMFQHVDTSGVFICPENEHIMSLEFTVWATDKDIPPTPKLVLMALADGADPDTGITTIRFAELTTKLHMSYNALRWELGSLGVAGIIKEFTASQPEGWNGPHPATFKLLKES